MRPKNERVRNTVMAALLLATLLLGARLAEGAVNTTRKGLAPLEQQKQHELIILPCANVSDRLPA